MPIDDDNLFNDLATTIWGNRADGLPVPEFNLKRDITPQELQYLHYRFAFIQIVNPEAEDEFLGIELLIAKNGWNIINYKNAIAGSPGELLFTEYSTNLSPSVTGAGTRIKQIMDVAAEIVILAKQEHWPSIFIVDGHPKMKWAIWKASRDLAIAVTGYLPTAAEEAQYQRIQHTCPSLIIPTVTTATTP